VLVLVQELDNYKHIIYDCFSTDKDLIEKWHIESGSTLENCTNRTYNDMKDLDLKFNTIYKEDKLLGYFGKEKFNNMNFLTGFFIKPEYRNKDNIKEFWNIVNNTFENKLFYAGLYNKNVPAINFLTRNGGKELNKVGDFGVVFMFNQENF
jgi:hypothetical protein